MKGMEETQKLREALQRIYNRCLSMADADNKGLLISIRQEAESALGIGEELMDCECEGVSENHPVAHLRKGI